MQANSAQRAYRISIFLAPGSFIGYALFPLFYLYKDRQLADASAALADEIQDTHMRCAAGAPQRKPECERMPDLRVRLYRGRAVRQAYRDKALAWLGLAPILALLSLAGGKWWHWIATGRIRPRKKPQAQKK